MRNVKIIAVWTLQILVGLMFVLLGVMRRSHEPRRGCPSRTRRPSR